MRAGCSHPAQGRCGVTWVSPTLRRGAPGGRTDLRACRGGVGVVGDHHGPALHHHLLPHSLLTDVRGPVHDSPEVRLSPRETPARETVAC